MGAVGQQGEGHQVQMRGLGQRSGQGGMGWVGNKEKDTSEKDHQGGPRVAEPGDTSAQAEHEMGLRVALAEVNTWRSLVLQVFAAGAEAEHQGAGREPLGPPATRHHRSGRRRHLDPDGSVGSAADGAAPAQQTRPVGADRCRRRRGRRRRCSGQQNRPRQEDAHRLLRAVRLTSRNRGL